MIRFIEGDPESSETSSEDLSDYEYVSSAIFGFLQRHILKPSDICGAKLRRLVLKVDYEALVQTFHIMAPDDFQILRSLLETDSAPDEKENIEFVCQAYLESHAQNKGIYRALSRKNIGPSVKSRKTNALGLVLNPNEAGQSSGERSPSSPDMSTVSRYVK